MADYQAEASRCFRARTGVKPMAENRRIDAVAAVREWFENLPSGLATLREQTTEVEDVLSLIPTRSGGASVTFGVSRHDTMDICVGREGNFDEVEASPQLVRDMCNAVREGRVEERVRAFLGLPVAVTTIVDMGGRRMTHRLLWPWGLVLFVLCVPKKIRYVPW